MERSDLALRLVSLAAALALVIVVHGEKRTTATYEVPLEPGAGLAADRLPATVRVSVSGPWARLRRLDAGVLGPAEVAVSRAPGGAAAWYVLAEKLHVPHGLRVESIHPAQGTIELRAAAQPSGPSRHPEEEP